MHQTVVFDSILLCTRNTGTAVNPFNRRLTEHVCGGGGCLSRSGWREAGGGGGISDIYNKSGSCSLIPNLLPGCLVTSQSDGFGVTELQYVLCASGYIKVSTNLHQLRYNSFSNRDIDCMWVR